MKKSMPKENKSGKAADKKDNAKPGKMPGVKNMTKKGVKKSFKDMPV